jgi:adenosylhomocysteine nucleosidase
MSWSGIMDDVWVIMALESEAPDLANHPRVVISGLGKVNAAIAATRIAIEHRPSVMINIGTAGGITVTSGLCQPQRFVQRDMHCEPLGYAAGHTPFETQPAMIDFGPGLICSTGDDFVTNSADLAGTCDLVDMESYAVAKVCRQFGINFLCWKWISDQANDDSAHEWQQKISAGQAALQQQLALYGF